MCYIPLRIHSPFSVGFGAVKLDEIVAFATENGIPAAGVTDLNTLGGALTISKTLAAAKIQPLVGASLEIRHADQTGQIVLFASSQEGYEALLRCVNARNLDPKTPALAIAELAKLLGNQADQVIALTGGEDGLIENMIDNGKKTMPVFEELTRLFKDRLYVELQRETTEPGRHEASLLKAAAHFGLPVVATAPAHYPDEAGLEAHDVFLCISDKTYLGTQGRRKARPGRHLITPAEMQERFADMPEALANSVEIARKCAFMLRAVAPVMPVFPGTGEKTEAELLDVAATEGLERRLEAHTGFEGFATADDYRTRLAYEMSVISRMGFAGYFLIVADFISWARQNDIPVGPGRGSGAGSLVAYALGITDIDPLEFGLIFERFLNPERVSMPDFDIDFCKERREEVIDYVRGKYGDAHVAQIAAFGTLQARAAVRDVARAIEIPFRVADEFAKMIPAGAENLSEAMEDEEIARTIERADDDIQTLFRIALKLEGLFRTVSTHAAGVIISARPVAEVVPCHIDHQGKLSTSYEMKAVEAAGLVKFDFLGLKNLDLIKGAIDFVASTKGERIDLDEIGFADARTFAQLATGDGFSVFQLESQGMRQAMKQLEVETIEDLIALISLYRPGPMDQIQTYADVKHGREMVHYDHPEMKAVLEPTHGVMIYQEQVMEIARRIGGYSMGDADLLRRAMGKKIQSEMDAQASRFASGAAAGWVEIETEDGESRKVHALAKFPVSDGSGRQVTLKEAMEENLDVTF